MNKILALVYVLASLSPLVTFAYTSPGAPQGFVSDFANILSNEAQQSLEQKITTFAQEKNHEIAIVTIQTLSGDDIESYTNTLFREWGIGSKQYNNGVLFLVALDERKMRIEVGYGLEGALTDIESKRIQEDIVRPLFREGKFEEGLVAGADAIIRAIEGEELPAQQSSQKLSWLSIIERYGGEILFVIIFFLSWIASILGRTKSWWLGGVIGGGAGGVVALITQAWLWLPIVAIVGLLFDYFVSKNYQSHQGNHPAWWAGGSWGGWDRWSGGGGFGGFGGGSSGGGGSSSGW